ncbi:hypothetical protein XELAEV_18020640mg [Xenopus laevis]|uniref:Uncharacterized protein n=1 Tax=Xenopus laevis TaxID=8355 RepID=A0A974D920_XENLA|nr:hypothetical protein XELAEV_18020640mg [Xenopus laevis]
MNCISCLSPKYTMFATGSSPAAFGGFYCIPGNQIQWSSDIGCPSTSVNHKFNLQQPFIYKVERFSKYKSVCLHHVTTHPSIPVLMAKITHKYLHK